jgi:hypothetical protein
MASTVFDKTEKGREEISTRKYQLPPRLRTLLVMIDGKQDAEDLLHKVGSLGIGEENITELLDNGFIKAMPSSAPIEAVAPVAQASVVTSEPPADQFYTETIKSAIGLRGYALQLKVEKASSIADFRELRQPYLEAVLKAKGNEMAQSLRSRLDQLLAT